MMDTAVREEIEYTDLSELDKVAERIVAFAGNTKVWAFEGEMGLGKTTLIKAICRYYNVGDNVTSPSFSIVNEYQSNNHSFYHFDFYRLKNETEALDIGVEEYFYSGNHCFIEWPSKIKSLLPAEFIKIDMFIKDKSRTIKLFKNTNSLN